MTGEKFTLMQYSVSGILGLIELHDFVIPEIQRPFVWDRSQRARPHRLSVPGLPHRVHHYLEEPRCADKRRRPFQREESPD